MSFYPSTLKRQWYMEDVCSYIIYSLEGAMKWNAYAYQNEVEKAAFIETFEECERLVKQNNLQPKAMLQALSDLHDTLPMMPKPSFFSLARWYHYPLEARERAIIIAFDLVDGISNRFLCD